MFWAYTQEVTVMQPWVSLHCMEEHAKMEAIFSLVYYVTNERSITEF